MAASDGTVPVDNAVVIPTFIGSVLSFVATAIAIGLHILFPPKRHFRHALIINLLVADCINSLNNTISGGIILGTGRTGSPSSPVHWECLANSWVGQFTVQTVDFTILVISISVLYTVYSKSPARSPSMLTAVLVCAATWIPGLITSNVGLGLNAYGHVSGNWCWILPKYLGLRYGLTHGWRIAVFIATIIIYTLIYIRLKRVFAKARSSQGGSLTFPTSTAYGSRIARNSSVGGRPSEMSDRHQILASGPEGDGDIASQEMHPYTSHPPHLEVHTSGEVTPSGSSSLDPDAKGPPLSAAASHTEAEVVVQEPPPPPPHQGPTPNFRMPPPPNLRKTLLMNGYPIAYIILWIPGMANRLAESIAYSPEWLNALQASTQFVGLVNALTYGINEHLRRQAWTSWKERRGFRRSRDSNC